MVLDLGLGSKIGARSEEFLELIEGIDCCGGGVVESA